MSLLDRFRSDKQDLVVKNAEPNRIHTVGLDDIKADLDDNRSQKKTSY